MTSAMYIDARGHVRDATGIERIEHYGWEVTPEGCWEYSGRTKHKFGYLQVAVGGGKKVEAHRVAYLGWVGEIPDGMQVRHTCDNPPCINPEHLILGTSQDNHDDMVNRGRALNGDRNPAAKLTAAQVTEIKHRNRAGETQTALALEYGVSQSLVSVIMSGKRRKVG